MDARRFVVFGFVATATLVACSFGPDAEGTGKSEAAAVSDILTMTRRDDGRFDVVCRDNTREIVTADDIRADRVCRGGPAAPDAGAGRLGVIFGRTDSCEASAAIVTVRESTDCMRLSASEEAWSIMVGNRCQNIADTSVRAACFQLKPRGTILFGRTDRCEMDQALTTIDAQTDCLSLSPTTEVWSVSVDGRCQNIGDTNMRAACLALQPGDGAIIFGRTDRCDADQALLRVTDETDCLRLSASQDAWSISVNGRCQNIGDTNVRQACLTAQGSL